MRLAVVAGSIALAACSGGAKPPPIEPKPVEAPLDPPCPPVEDITLADGKLRCRELPVVLDFPANTKLKRVDDGNYTFINAALERGVLAVFVEPRFDVQDDVAGVRGRLETVAKKIAEDATITEVPALPQEGATISTAITFATADGGAGVAYGYIAHGWFIGVFAGGRKADTSTRPDQPEGKAFLASLKLRPVSTKWIPHEQFGVKLELPAAAWEGAPVKTQGKIERGAKLWTVPHERVWIGARELDQSPQCGLFANVTDADVPVLVKKLFGQDDLNVTGKLAKVGTQAMFAQVETPGGTMAMYLVCSDPHVMLITVTGKRPAAELLPLLDRVTSSFKR